MRTPASRRLAHRVWLLSLSLLAVPGIAARSQEPPGVSLPVREITLPNGMRLLVLPRPGAPTVAFVVQYAVGSVNERLGTTGIAHLLEHLLFKGTTTVGTRDLDAERALFGRIDAVHDSLLRARAESPADSARASRLAAAIDALEDSARAYVESNELDRILSRQGARGLNASTTTESTLYYVQLPANRAELWFALEADRMRNPVFREFYAERDVVTEERRMRVEDNPAGRLYELHLATAYLMHPYGVPVIGWMSDIQALSRAQVEEYYRRYYAPSNAVVAVVGNVDPAQIEGWARQYLGGVPAGERPPPVLVREPEQSGERRVQVEYDAEPVLRIGWHVPEISHVDMPALAVLATLLTGGRTTRLYRELVLEQRAATAVFATLGPGDLYPQLFQIEAVPRAPHTTAELEQLIYGELQALADKPPTQDELERVRNQMRAGEVRRLESNLGLAFQLADSETLFGDWSETFRLGRRLVDVQPEDVQRVIRRYFTASNRTVATLVKPAAPGRTP